DAIFDTVTLTLGSSADELIAKAEQAGYLLRRIDAQTVGITFDETSTEADLQAIAKLAGISVPDTVEETLHFRPEGFLSQPVFHANRSETQMMRFLRSLSDKDLALDRAMIPLGSCTMKLN